MCRTFITLLLLQSVLYGCASTQKTIDHNTQIKQWINNAVVYQQNLPADHPDHYQSITHITPEMLRLAREQTRGVRNNRHIDAIANWLINKDGHAMSYDVNANLSPVQAFEQQTGNCLSFTILLINLAQQLGVHLDYNEVDIPDSWDSEGDNRFVLYRHVNAVLKTPRETQVFDLAINNYDVRYPQRYISKQKAISLLHNNRSMQALQKEDLDKAMHYMKLAIALDPNSADLFTNLASIFKRDNQLAQAELFFLASLNIEPKHIVANSNLERLYRSQGKIRQANVYAKLANKARNDNPYYLYKKAQEQNEMKEFTKAKRSITRAKRLHNSDSRFYELSSRINQSLGNYKYALNELIRAHKLAINQTNREHYANKAIFVAQKWVAQRDAKKRPTHVDYGRGMFQRAR